MNVRTPLPTPHATPAIQTDITLRLRLLGTTDLHAHLLPYDYHADEGGRPYGLARTATLIRAARAEAPNVMLFDNGDALQGTPVSDITAQSGNGWSGPNPVIAAMNRLGYDAATLGNHEFNFGLDWLDRTLADATFPLTCANVHMSAGTAPARTYLPPYLLLRRTVTDEAGVQHPLTLGVIGLVPPQITTWDRAHLSGQLLARDMIDTAAELVPKVRDAGADLVLLLAHTGIDAGPRRPMMENAALPLAVIPGVDAIMAGHSHGVFPRPGAPDTPGIDHTRGLLGGTPALMAGAYGSHLGILDLLLERRGKRWRVTSHRSEALPVAPRGTDAGPAPGDTGLSRALRPAHLATLRHMRKPIGTSAQRLHSYLALARPDPSVAAVNALQRRLLARALKGGAHDGLPILSATAAFKIGGRGGPQRYTDLPSGPLSLRHAADLYPFPNHLCGVLVTGAELRDWLERAAICFATHVPGAPEGMLRDYDVPGHDFDVIAGLTYRIDLSAPPRYDRHGRVANPGARRIREIRHEGRPLRRDDRFVLATNTYRAHGGGAFARIPASRIVHVAAPLLHDQIVNEIRRTPLAAPPDYPQTWRFCALPGTRVLLDTGPALRADPDALKDLDAEDLGLTAEGFWRLRLRF